MASPPCKSELSFPSMDAPAPSRNLVPHRLRVFLVPLVPLWLLATACGAPDRGDALPGDSADVASTFAEGGALAPEDDPPPPAPSPEGAAPVAGAEHLRALTFLSLASDSTTLLPWSFRSTITEEGILRHRQASLGRGGTWEPLLADTLVTPLSRFPWRILPGGPVRLVVGEGDAVASLLFDAPPRTVELIPGEFLAEWVPDAGSVWRIHRGEVVLPSGGIQGLLLDLSRSRGPGSAPGLDWMFLHDGAGTQVLLREPPGATEREAGVWLGWSRVAFQERNWNEVQVRWSGVRPLERARRDIPTGWSLEAPRPGTGTGAGTGTGTGTRSGGGAGTGAAAPAAAFGGELRVVRSFLDVEEGPGPILPVEGFLEVEGEILILGERLAVRGVVRHRQR